MAKRRIDPRVEIGSVRLDVTDLDRAAVFYERVLGFEITRRIEHSSVTLSAGGYHPHIVLNFSGGARTAGRFAIRYPDRSGLADALSRLEAGRVEVLEATDSGLRESLYVRDPDGNDLELYFDRPPDEWPRNGDGTLRVASEPLNLDELRAIGAASNAVDAAPSGHPVSTAPLSEETRRRLGEMRARLLNLHKVLLDDTTAAYEMDRGRIGSNANLLQLVINDPWFAWLHPLSELVVRIDETLQADAPATEADGEVLLEQVGRLLSPVQGVEVFAQRYYEALQRQPAVIVAHAEVRRILKQAK